MAMPTSAAASAGASLTPSPAMATTRPSPAQLLDHGALLVGQHLGLDLVDAELPRDGLRGGAVVAGQHDDADAFGRAAPSSASGVVALTGSAMAMTPASLPSMRDEDRGRAVAAQPLGLARRARRVDAELGQELRVAEHDACGRRPCRSRPCRSASRSPRTVRERELALRARPRRWRRPADARSRARRWRQAAAPRSRRSPAPATIATTFGLPSVSVPVLSTTSVSTFSMRSSASAFLISTPACAPRPTPTMIDIGVARPSAQGQAMISTRHGGDQAVGEARLRPEQRPGGEGEQRDRDHRRHEPAGDLVGQPLDRRARALRLRHHLHDLRQHRVAADLLGAHHEAAGLVERAADHLGAGLLGRPASTRRSPSIRRPWSGLRSRSPSTGTFSPGPHAQPVADRDCVERDLLVAAVAVDAARGLRREIEQRADRAGGRSRARSSSTWPSSTSTVMTAAASK